MAGGLLVLARGQRFLPERVVLRRLVLPPLILLLLARLLPASPRLLLVLLLRLDPDQPHPVQLAARATHDGGMLPLRVHLDEDRNALFVLAPRVHGDPASAVGGGLAEAEFGDVGCALEQSERRLRVEPDV